MKTFFDRLKEMPIDGLRTMIKKQKKEIEISFRDLDLMEKVYKERMQGEVKSE